MAGKVENAEKSLLEMYLTTPEIDFKDVIGMSADMLLAGIDTVSLSHLPLSDYSNHNLNYTPTFL